MKEKIKGLILGILIGSAISGSIVLAKNGTEYVEILYNNIKVYKDNVLCELRDANGEVIEPFVYNGTTYMPIRGTANLLDVQVEWDGANKSVKLWDEILPSGTYFMDVCPPYTTKDYNVYHTCEVYSSANTESFSMGGEKYSNGLALAGCHSSNTYALFNLNGQYKELEMVIAPIDGNEDPSGIAFIVDGKNVAEYIVKEGDYPKTIKVPLNYGLQLKIVTIDGEGRYYTGLGNIVVR